MEEFVQTWGYFAVFLGSLVEGESIIFVAGWLAHEGFLSLPKIILVSFVGTLFADQSLFFIGYYWGKSVLARFPSLETRSQRAFDLLKRYNVLFILSFRFIYGIRTLSPLVIGTSGLGIKKFMILNLIAAAVWSLLSCFAAYYFAALVLDKIHLIPKIFLILLGGGGCFFYFVRKWRRSRQAEKQRGMLL